MSTCKSVREIEHVWITMADGVRLSARLWLPEGTHDNAVPAILEYIPYRKRDMVRIRDERNHRYFARHGYACVRVDMRGSGDSEGLMPDMYSPDELDDAVEVIAWISRQDWCNGSVGMMGTSWGGTSAFQAAARRPGALKAIIAVCATNNRYEDDIHHMGGCLLTDTVEWGATLPAILASPPDPQTVGEKWREIWTRRLDQLAFPLENWISHEDCDAYWKWGSLNQAPAEIQCPVLMFGGWADRYSNTVMNVLTDCRDHCWGVIGPWGHHYPSQASPGPGIGFQQESLKWWDFWLKGVQNGIMEQPKLRTWMLSYDPPADRLAQRSGYWISEPQWPSGNVQRRRYYFGENALTADGPGSGQGVEVPWSLEVGGHAGDTGYFGRPGGLPLNQETEDQNSLVFDTPPLAEPLEVLGRITLDIAAKMDGSTGTVVVRVCDVSPDGVSARVSWAVQNLALTGGEPDPSPAGSIKELSLSLPNIAYRFEKGHRLRIAFSCSYWPMIWTPPKATRIELMPDKMSASIPLRVKQGEDAATANGFESVLNSDLAEYRTLEAGVLCRSLDVDEATGRRTVSWHQPPVSFRYPAIDLNFGYETSARHSIDTSDPNSALTRYEHTLRYERTGHEIEVTGTASLACSETQYRISGELRVVENGRLVFNKKWRPALDRKYS